MIEYEICAVKNIVDQINKISNNTGIKKFELKTKTNEKGQKIISNDTVLKNFFDKVRSDLVAYVEYPYVDKLYRDAYYNYYSKRNENFDRNCIRISFFKSKDKKINHTYFENLTPADLRRFEFLGFITIRPTSNRRLGRNFLNPKAMNCTNLNMISCETRTLVHGYKFQTTGYPHASQDGNYFTCAETSIWAIMEYFGKKYSSYNSVLISKIIFILKKRTSERQTPSEGLSWDQISYVLRKLGFAPIIFHKEVYKKMPGRFEELINIYVESAIPVIVIYNGKNENHTNLIIGYENHNLIEKKDPQTKLDIDNKEENKNISYIPTHDRNYVLIDDNYPPYVTLNLNQRGKINGFVKPKDYAGISGFIVPNYNKVYLDAFSARSLFIEIFEDETIGMSAELREKTKFYFTIKLMPSRTFKEKISQDTAIREDMKELILAQIMPKFIWISQFGSLDLLNNSKTNGLIVLDSTSYDNGVKTEHLLLALYNDKMVLEKPNEPDLFFSNYKDNLPNFRLINNNLKSLQRNEQN